MSTQTGPRKHVTLHDLRRMKEHGEKIAVVTAYDATAARLVDQAGVDCILVGDSLGMVFQGHDSTLPVTLADMVYHTAMVARGCDRPIIVTDMPFGTYQETPELAFRNAVQLMNPAAERVLAITAAVFLLVEDLPSGKDGSCSAKVFPQLSHLAPAAPERQ